MNPRNETAREETLSFVKSTQPLATPDKNIRGQEGEDGRAKYFTCGASELWW